MSDRTTKRHRVVPLTDGELEMLLREARNPALCCGHMSCLHTSGRTAGGKHYTFCNVDGCECAEEEP